MGLSDKLEQPRPAARAEISLDGGTLDTGPLEEPIGSDWSPILRSFGLDPAVFRVKDDTVRMSKWQQSKRLENGDRDQIWLYSYRAQFEKTPAPVLSDSDFEVLLRRNAPRKPQEPFSGTGTLVVCWADWQIGKSAGGGIEGVLERVRDSINNTVKRLKTLRKQGVPITDVCIALMGDPIESCYGHYESQTFTVELTLRQQLLAALDLYIEGIYALLPLANKLSVVAVLSNHGEWSRRTTGGRQITSDSDSADGFLADALRRILPNEDIHWVIPHDEMTMLHDLSGVPVAFTHGHKIPSEARETEWLRGQSIRLLRDHGREPKVWVTAHRHHLRVEDMGPWWRLQCPSNDGGSKWFEDSAGKWSTAGTLTFVVGVDPVRFVSDIAVI